MVSGAAGIYIVTLTEDAGISTDLMIQPGQDVHISGDPNLAVAPSWGSGGFEVQEGGSLSLTGMAVMSGLTVKSGGSVAQSGGSLGGNIKVAGGGTIQLSNVIYEQQTLTLTATQNLQCDLPYITLSDSWRAITGYLGPGGKQMGDTATSCSHNDQQATGVGGGRWYRFDGAGGDALPLTPPGQNHCGTSYTGWLSGYQGPPQNTPAFPEQGRYPLAAEGVVDMTACFDYASGGGSCYGHAMVGVVRCGEFLLWRLADTAAAEMRGNPGGSGGAGCNHAYCTVTSGL